VEGKVPSGTLTRHAGSTVRPPTTSSRRVKRTRQCEAWSEESPIVGCPRRLHDATSKDQIVPPGAEAAVKGLCGARDLDIEGVQTKGVLPKGHLEPDATYKVGPNDAYMIKSDMFGRFKSAEGDLQPFAPKLKRSSLDQRLQAEAGKLGRRSTKRVAAATHDIGFDTVPFRNGGGGTAKTLIAGNGDMNNTDFRSYENLLNRHLEARDDVSFKHTAHYNDGTNRAEAVEMNRTINGKTFERGFANEARLKDGAGPSIAGSTVVKDVRSIGRGSEVGLESAVKFAKGVDAVGRFAAPFVIAGDVIQVGSAYHQDGNSIGRHTVDALASSAGLGRCRDGRRSRY